MGPVRGVTMNNNSWARFQRPFHLFVELQLHFNLTASSTSEYQPSSLLIAFKHPPRSCAASIYLNTSIHSPFESCSRCMFSSVDEGIHQGRTTDPSLLTDTPGRPIPQQQAHPPASPTLQTGPRTLPRSLLDQASPQCANASQNRCAVAASAVANEK